MKITISNSPVAIRISPGTRGHLKVCMMPIGNKLMVTITSKPILMSQKAQPIPQFFWSHNLIFCGLILNSKFFFKFDGFWKENIVFEMDVGMKVLFEFFEHRKGYSVGIAGICRRIVI